MSLPAHSSHVPTELPSPVRGIVILLLLLNVGLAKGVQPEGSGVIEEVAAPRMGAGPSLPGETCTGNSGLNCPGAIPDGPGGVLVSTFDYPGSTCDGTIGDVNIGVALAHPRIGDLEITVSGPTAIPLRRGPLEVVLFDRQCGSSDDIEAIFDDEGSSLPCPPVGLGRWTPEELLLVFDGFFAEATWELRIEDHASGEVGTLLDWSVEVACVVPATPPVWRAVLLLLLLLAGAAAILRRRGGSRRGPA